MVVVVVVEEVVEGQPTYIVRGRFAGILRGPLFGDPLIICLCLDLAVLSKMRIMRGPLIGGP